MTGQDSDDIINLEEEKRILSQITRKDIDNLVQFCEIVPELKKILQDLDMAAKKQNVELIDIIKGEIEWYYKRHLGGST